MNLTAKPIIKNEYWVVTDGKKKVGNVIHEGSDYKVILDNKKETYTNTKEIEKTKKIVFEKIEKPNKQTNPSFAVYPTTNRTSIIITMLKENCMSLLRLPKANAIT